MGLALTREENASDASSYSLLTMQGAMLDPPREYLGSGGAWRRCQCHRFIANN